MNQDKNGALEALQYDYGESSASDEDAEIAGNVNVRKAGKCHCQT